MKKHALHFITVDSDVILARLSDTETKIKFYCSVKEQLNDTATYPELQRVLDEKVDRMMKDIIG